MKLFGGRTSKYKYFLKYYSSLPWIGKIFLLAHSNIFYDFSPSFLNMHVNFFPC